MLTTLVIKDFAIISELELSFGSGMTVLSGETGAGKSIIINAMKLLLGGRASSDIVRSGAREAVVEGMFTVEPGQNQVRRYLTALGIHIEDDEFVVRRTIPRSGRGHVFIGGTLQSLATLRELMRCVADISGQHEHVSLLDSSRHLTIVDRYAGLEEYGGCRTLCLPAQQAQPTQPRLWRREERRRTRWRSLPSLQSRRKHLPPNPRK